MAGAVASVLGEPPAVRLQRFLVHPRRAGPGRSGMGSPPTAAHFTARLRRFPGFLDVRIEFVNYPTEIVTRQGRQTQSSILARVGADDVHAFQRLRHRQGFPGDQSARDGYDHRHEWMLEGGFEERDEFLADLHRGMSSCAWSSQFVQDSKGCVCAQFTRREHEVLPRSRGLLGESTVDGVEELALGHVGLNLRFYSGCLICALLIYLPRAGNPRIQSPIILSTSRSTSLETKGGILPVPRCEIR
jgi:hypothetical protein